MANPLYPDIHNTLNTQSAMSGNMVDSNGDVYNIVDLLLSTNLQEGVTTAQNIPTTNGSNVQLALESIGTEIDNLESELDIIKNDLGDLGDIQNGLANSFLKQDSIT